MESESGSAPPRGERRDVRSLSEAFPGLKESLDQLRAGDVSPALTAEEEERATIYEELTRDRRETVESSEGAPPPPPGRVLLDTPPAPTGGGHPHGVAYYFTANVGTEADPIFQTCVREIAIPRDATVECVGNTLVIRHEGVADTFRIGRVRPLEG